MILSPLYRDKIMRVECRVGQIFLCRRGVGNIFIDFQRYFRFAMMEARRVVGGIESAAESLLSGDESMTCTKVAYRSHLIIANPFFIFFK